MFSVPRTSPSVMQDGSSAANPENTWSNRVGAEKSSPVVSCVGVNVMRPRLLKSC